MVDVRITSTYVENTMPKSCIKCFTRDHLHIRGEYSSALSSLSVNEGSPPHTWRILTMIRFFLKTFRITSTYVENTPTLYKT